MRCLVLSQFFPPELVAGGVRVASFTQALADAGHDVTVICEVPNHPSGVVAAGYRGRALVRRRRGRLAVRYVAVATSEVKTTRTRLAFYASYAAMATAVGCAQRRPDVLLASSPPLPVAAAAAVVAHRHRVPWVFDVRDLWPHAAVALGELGPGRALRLAEGLERALYADAAAVVTTTAPFRDAILGTRPSARVEVLPNGTTQEWLDAARLAVPRAELGLPEDRFVWTYAGNVGLAQGLDTALAAAELLGEGFQLLIVGDGPLRARLEARSRDLPASAVAWRPLVPASVAARYMRASDALLVSLAGGPALAGFVPSKLFDCCAVARPVLVAAGDEPRRLVEHAGAAMTVPPGDAAGLAAAVRRLRDEPPLRDRLSERGHAFARAHRRDVQAQRMLAILSDVAAARR